MSITEEYIKYCKAEDELFRSEINTLEEELGHKVDSMTEACLYASFCSPQHKWFYELKKDLLKIK